MLLIENQREGDITDADILALSNALGGATVRRLSELPVIKRASNGRSSGYKQAKGFEYHPSCRYDNSSEWTRIDVSLDEMLLPAIYAPMDRHDMENTINLRLVLSAVDSGLIGEPVIAVNKRTSAIIEKKKKDGWMSVDEAAMMILEMVEDANVLADMRAREKYEAHLGALEIPTVVQQHPEEWANAVDKDSLLGTILRTERLLSRRIEQLSNRIHRYRDQLLWARNNLHGAPVDDKERTYVAKKLGRQKHIDVKRAYPLLPHLSRINNYEKLKDVIEYVKLMDERG